MAEVIPGFIAGTVPSNVHRMIHAATFMRGGAAGSTGQVVARSGVLGYKSLRVAPSSALTVSIASGMVLLQGSTNNQGAYLLVNDADDTVTLNTASTTLARKDAVIARVYDTTDGVGGNGNQWVLDKVTGTPAASPTLPTLPTDSILLAEVNVAANATTVLTGNIVDRRVFTVATGGVLPCTSTGLPTDPAPGQMVWLTDINALDVWDGSVYQRMYRPRVWTDLALAPAYANYGSGYANLGYTVNNNTVFLRGVIKSTTSTSNTATVATLPVGARPSYRLALSITGPGASNLFRYDIFPTGVIGEQTAHAALSSILFDNISFPLG